MTSSQFLHYGANAVLLIALSAGSAVAQRKATVVGVVRDSAGPVRDVDVGIVALRRLTKSDEQGRFIMNELPPGELVLSVRRLGYTPVTLHRVVAEQAVDSVFIDLERVATLEGVDVTASVVRQRFWVEDFYRRVMRGVGTYVTREDIEHKRASTPSEILRTLPGIRVVRTRSTTGIRFISASNIRRDCMPMIWIDGQEAPGMQIDDIPLSTIEGIELYKGPSTTPLQFSQGATSTCGTIVVWSRIPGT